LVPLVTEVHPDNGPLTEQRLAEIENRLADGYGFVAEDGPSQAELDCRLVVAEVRRLSVENTGMRQRIEAALEIKPRIAVNGREYVNGVNGGWNYAVRHLRRVLSGVPGEQE
jgi:hypothetical protein